jgi:phage baseplate assembly protein W
MATNARADLVRSNLLGRGLRLGIASGDGGRDLDVALTPRGTLDLGLVAGIDNLGQALAVAITTPLGGDVFNLQFGFDGLNALADEASPVVLRERVRVAIVNLLRRDPRVARVVDVRLLDARLDTPSTGVARQLEVRVVFETVSADLLTLTAGTQGATLDHG